MTHALRTLILALALALVGGVLAQEAGDGDGADGGQDGAAGGSIAEALRGDPRLSMLAELLDGTGLMLQLEDSVRLTLFAPSDRAFEAVGATNVAELLRNRGPLDTVLRHHMVWGAAPEGALRRMDALTTVEGTRLTLTRSDGVVQVDGVPVRDVLDAGEGIVYVVDRLLLPEASVMVKDLLSYPAGR